MARLRFAKKFAKKSIAKKPFLPLEKPFQSAVHSFFDRKTRQQRNGKGICKIEEVIAVLEYFTRSPSKILKIDRLTTFPPSGNAFPERRPQLFQYKTSSATGWERSLKNRGGN